MTLASLYNLPNTPTSRATWSFANADLHTRINQRLKHVANLDLTYRILDPMPEGDAKSWLQLHQQTHIEQNAALGIIGNDLSDVDFKNENQLRAWLWLHFQEMSQAVQKLGI